MVATTKEDSVHSSEIHDIEVTLLLEGIFRRYGYDFRSYARASVERRLRHFSTSAGFDHIAELIPKTLREEDFFSDLAQALSVPTTEMFRDPDVYLKIRRRILPVLRTWPHFKIWHAGCSTGEEVYSLAILLAEEGLADRATIYATDFNDKVLATAKEGIYSLERMRTFTASYQKAGGRGSFSDYYHARYDSAVLDPLLRKQVTFANHNLAVDGAFGEMHLILCRNVLIYFDRDLQDRVLNIFAESLVNGGFLCLGTKEDLHFSAVADDFVDEHSKAKIYKRVGVRDEMP